MGMDNYYASPELYEILLENRTDAVGTVRFNRKNLSTVVSKKKLKKGKHPSVQKEDDAYEMERQKRREHAQYYL